MDKHVALDLLNVMIDNHKSLLQEHWDVIKLDNDISMENKVHELKEVDFKIMIVDELKEYVRRHLK